MEVQRTRKEKRKKPRTRDCDFVIEDTKRYNGEIYGKQFDHEVCIEHPYHNHVLKIRNKDELSSDLDEALALEEIQRDYDEIADIGDAYAGDSTIDSGFLSVKDTSTEESDLLAIDTSREELRGLESDTTVTVIAVIETSNDISDYAKDVESSPSASVTCDQNFEEDKEIKLYMKQMSESPKNLNRKIQHITDGVNNIENEVSGSVESEAHDTSGNNKHDNTSLVTNARETENSKPKLDENQSVTIVAVDNEDVDESVENVVSASRYKVQNNSVYVMQISNEKVKASLNETTERKQLKEDATSSEISIESGAADLRSSTKRRYRYTSQISNASIREDIEEPTTRKESTISAAGSARSRTESLASRSISMTTATDSISARPKIMRSKSASFSHSIRSLKRSFSFSLRSLTGSLRSLFRKDDSLSGKTKPRSHSVKSLPNLSKPEKRDSRKFKRYSLDSTTSSIYYDRRKTRMENEVAAYERRNKLLQGYCRQADYMEKCFDMRDRKDEPYRGSRQQYRDCLKLCTKLDLELQRQRPLAEEEKYKHIPYIDQD